GNLPNSIAWRQKSIDKKWPPKKEIQSNPGPRRSKPSDFRASKGRCRLRAIKARPAAAEGEQGLVRPAFAPQRPEEVREVEWKPEGQPGTPHPEARLESEWRMAERLRKAGRDRPREKDPS